MRRGARLTLAWHGSARSARSALWVVVLGPFFVACFDVEQVDVHAIEAKPTPRLIDDFNDDFDNSERQPTDASFGPWRCFGRGGSVQVVRCDAGPGTDGTQGRAITFDLFDGPDGRRDYRGAELQTRALVTLDFSRYERFVFSAALDAGATPNSIPVQIALYCDDLLDGILQSPYQPLESGVSFRACSTEMADFHQPDWQREGWEEEQRPPLNEPSCLAHVHAVSIVVEPDMPDGREAAGRVSVDDIYAQ